MKKKSDLSSKALAKDEITNQHLLDAIQDLDKKVDRNQQEILSGINDFSTEVEKRFDGIDRRFNGVEYRLGNLEYNQEDISSKLNNAAYRFEVRDLEKRVEVLETK